MLQPNILCDKIYDIDPALLEQMGIKALALDVDNTLTLHDSQEVPDRVRAFPEKILSMPCRGSTCSSGKVILYPFWVLPVAAKQQC